MKYQETCKYCELYGGCASTGNMPPDEKGCEDWELAFSIYQDLPEKEANAYITKYQNKHRH